MPKTTDITLVCKKVTIDAATKNEVKVVLEEPEVDHILEDIHREDLAAWLQENKDPDDVFTDEQLEKWAEDNGYTKQ